MTVLAEVFIPGKAKPQGSMRPVRTGAGRLANIHSRGLIDYRRLLADALADDTDIRRYPGPCAVTIESRMDRPAAHYLPANRRRAAPELRADAPAQPTGRNTGDTDKFARTCLDATTAAGVWIDDAQAVRLQVAKAWATDITPAGLTLRIEAIA